jgi:hypothetical protein
MSSTLDSINNKIILRFNKLDEILSTYLSYKIDENDELLINKNKEELIELQNNYIANTINIIKEYYQLLDYNKKKELHNKYVMTFHSLNITGRLKRIYNFCVKLRKKYELENVSINDMFREYDYLFIDESYDDKGAKSCPKCKIPYEIEEKSCEFICRPCGVIQKMDGVVFEDEQFFYQEGQRTKHGKYDTFKHAKLWTDRIQAKENTEIPEECINQIKRCVRQDNIWIDRISCELIRTYLKRLKLTQYNNHVPLIRRIITGKEPPQFSDKEINLLYMYFSMIIHVFNKIKEKPNCPYHPYFIYKIIEQILPETTNKEKLRKKEILSCIHLQSRETLIENDKMWFSICDHIPDFNKKATDY